MVTVVVPVLLSEIAKALSIVFEVVRNGVYHLRRDGALAFALRIATAHVFFRK
jgi:hypothetical protein